MTSDVETQGFLFHLRRFCLLFLLLLILQTSTFYPKGPIDAIQASLGADKFKYIGWTFGALFNKAVSASLKAEKFLDDAQQHEVVKTYFDQVGTVEAEEYHLASQLDESGSNSNSFAVKNARERLNQANNRLRNLSLLTEAVIQNQTERTLYLMGFETLGQVFPPVLYQVSDLPLNLIVSPREEIATILSISLKPGIDDFRKSHIESDIVALYNLSALIEEVGGVGTYPTMVLRGNNINWMFETVAHEWIHNYLTLRPLGVRYFSNGEMRAINETTASLAGKEIGRAIIKSFYREHIVIGSVPKREPYWVVSEDECDSGEFDFRAEMHETRVTVDEMLSLGKVDEAEAYMENRRRVFWDVGYRIRKINQAYFAFYGSYNDTPGGGASGKDPIGPAVRALRYSQASLKLFIDTIQNVRSFDELMKIVP